MNGIEFGNFLQKLIDANMIGHVDIDKVYEDSGEINALKIDFNKVLKMAVIDKNGNMIPFECDSIDYFSGGNIEFFIEDQLYLSKTIQEIEKIHWRPNV